MMVVTTFLRRPVPMRADESVRLPRACHLGQLFHQIVVSFLAPLKMSVQKGERSAVGHGGRHAHHPEDLGKRGV